MKFIFVDEFKEFKKTHKFYGLVAILIDNSSYMRFKKGFYDKLKKLGWNKGIEIKGRYSFSATKGDRSVSVEDRLKFIESIFELSESGNKKYASAKVYYTFDMFSKNKSEAQMHFELFRRILSKIPSGTKKGNKNGNNNMVIFLDSNKDLDIESISNMAEEILSKKNLFLIERCIDFNSSNATPGILFADYVAYFINNYLKIRRFNNGNIKRIKELINKLTNNHITNNEKVELEQFINSLKKEHKSINLLKALKKMIYAK